MFDLSQLPLFVAACLVVLLVPGPNVLYVVDRTMTQGRKAGIVSVFGVETGTSNHHRRRYALLAGLCGQWLYGSKRCAAVQRGFAAVMFFGLGVSAALTKSSSPLGG